MRLTRLTDALKGRGRAPEPDPEFDPEFYASYYGDLAALRTPDRLLAHYVNHGRAEGRFRNQREALQALQEKHGVLPPGFDSAVYRMMHKDLRDSLKTDVEAAEHYLRYGHKEKREYVRFDPDLYRDLYFQHKVITDYELELHYKTQGVAEGRIGTLREFIQKQGITGGAWIDRFKRDEFELLNWSWCGRVETKLDGVRRFLSEGLARLAPISFDAVFDPAYYREVHPGLAHQEDAALYRHWLFEGLEKNHPGSAEEHMRKLKLRLRAFPEAFRWRDYQKARMIPGDRWFALKHLLDNGLKPGEPFPAEGPGAADFAFAVGLSWRGKKDPSAIAAFLRARELGDRSYPLAHHLGDAYFREEQWAQALRCFGEAAANPHAEVWTYANGARAATHVGAFRKGFELLERGVGSVSGDPVWRKAVHDVVEGYFKARTDRARKLYALEGGRPRADALVERLVDRAAEIWTRLDPIGAPIGASPEGKVVILASFDIRVCVHYRIEQKEEMFGELGVPYEVYRPDQWEEFISALPGAAAAIFFRLPAWPTVTRAMQAATKMGVPTYYEIDDLIFDSDEYPDTLESYGGLLSREDYESILFGVPLFRKAIRLCDYGISSTKPLARAVEPLVRTGKVFWLPNGLDSRNEHYLYAPPERLRRDDNVWIAYASGTKAHNSDFNELAGPALVDVLKAYPEARLLLVGYLALEPEFDAVREQVIRFDFVNKSETFWSMLAEADISLAVLKPTWATDSKSEIKWLEAGVMGIPSIVSETATYMDVLDEGRDALIARNVQDWRDALERLVTDAPLRADIGQRARDKAAREYSIKANAGRLSDILAPAFEKRRPGRPQNGKKRILLGNVWFPPQTIGGATRVLRNNLDAWLDAGLDGEFEFAVVTTDHDATPDYARRLETYRNVPVMRIATPMRPNNDWRPEDHEIRRVFGDFLEIWRPDLVHFHAIQRLTASVVQACQLADLPYMVTAHDAWWLSDWHFLVDDKGRTREPCETLPIDPPKGVTVSQSLDRRRLLRAALSGAEAVLGVSESFAQMHLDCGFDNVIATPNGVPPLTPAPRVRSASGRVRLAHVGNVSKHKGYHLIEAALKQSRFENLELTVIDHARSAGEAEQVTWGATPVRIIGKVPQDKVHLLYAETDVLLAPSIWPESYGLVAREALSAGLWVVASDLGAMGEDVEPGVNGFVIDVSTVDGLLGALSEINSAHGRYLQSPPVRPARRMASEQADQVMALYRRVLAGESLFSAPKRRTIPFAGTVATHLVKQVPRKTEFRLTQLQRVAGRAVAERDVPGSPSSDT